MAKKNTQQPQEQFKTMIGGQALIEGIMMLGPEKSAVVVRTKDGLQRKVEPRKLSQKWSPKKLPFIRGIFNFCTSMKTGVSALMYSADFFAEEDEDEKGKEPGRFEAWLEKRLSSEKAQNAAHHVLRRARTGVLHRAVLRAAVAARLVPEPLCHHE